VLAEKVLQLKLSAMHSVSIPAGEAQGFTGFTGPGGLLLFGPLGWCVICDWSE